MNNGNSNTYKFLRSKSLNKRKTTYDFDRTLSAVSEELLPATASNKRDNTAENTQEAAENAYEEKMRLMEKAQNKKLAQVSENSEREFERLGKQIQRGDSQNLELSESLRNAIERIASNKQRQAEGESSEEPQEEEQGIEDQPEPGTESYEDALLDPEDYDAPAPVQATAASTEEKSSTLPIGTRIAKKAVSIGDAIKVGQHIYNVTNTFGIRSGKNSVAGREGQHSKGMDLVGYSSDGKVSNLPIALTDGEIVGINLHGNGSVIRPENGKAGGYIMDVKMADGKIMKYMHLGKDVWDNKAKLLNKKIKRGDILYDGDYSKGSGSQTGPHIKVSITSVDSSNNQLRDYDAPENDPKTYALYGSYVEEY